MGALTWSEPGETIARSYRLDPEYFDPRTVIVAGELAQRGAKRLDNFVVGAWRGISPEYDPQGGVRVVKTANVQRFGISAMPAEFVAEDEDALSAAIPNASLLITSTGVGSAGRAFAYFGADRCMVADGHVTVLPLRCSQEDGAYICAFLQSPAGRQQVIRLHRGSSRQIEIYPDDLLTVLIPWPSQEVRHDIGRQWLAAVNSVEASRMCVRSAEMAIEQYVGLSKDKNSATREQSWEVMSNLFSVSLRLDPEYGAPRVMALRRALEQAGAFRLSDVIVRVDKGVQPESYDADGDVIVVKSKNVDYPDFDLAPCEHTLDPFSSNVKPGNVLINMTGEGSLGRAAVMPEFDESTQKIVASVDVAITTVDADVILPQFLALFLNSWIGRHQTRSLQTGSSGQQHLYPEHFSEIVIPVRKNPKGEVDLAWQRGIVMLAEQRSLASRTAAETGARLDKFFLAEIGIPVDLATIPY